MVLRETKGFLEQNVRTFPSDSLFIKRFPNDATSQNAVFDTLASLVFNERAGIRDPTAAVSISTCII